jgi:hypothetical protein
MMQTFTCEGGRRYRASEQKDDKITFFRQDWRCSRPHELPRLIPRASACRLFQPRSALKSRAGKWSSGKEKFEAGCALCTTRASTCISLDSALCSTCQIPDTLSTPKREDATFQHVRMRDAAVAYPPKRYRQVGHRPKSRHRPGHASGHTLHRMFQASRAPTYYSSKTKISNPG